MTLSFSPEADVDVLLAIDIMRLEGITEVILDGRRIRSHCIAITIISSATLKASLCSKLAALRPCTIYWK
jgi:hypothetical protein